MINLLPLKLEVTESVFEIDSHRILQEASELWSRIENGLSSCILLTSTPVNHMVSVRLVVVYSFQIQEPAALHIVSSQFIQTFV